METRTGLEIAVTGMAGRFPGARNIHEFWENLTNGKESITFFSDEELQALGKEKELLRHPNYVKAASILDDIEYFDAPFFGYTPREAELMAPQIRMFHECTWEALEDAGYVPQAYSGAIGLYAGSSTSAHWEALAALSGKRAAFGEFATNLLADKDQLSTRVSYNLSLSGPSFTIATACSTSLVAIHLACQGLLSGECRMAAAGGVTITIPRNYGYLYQEGSILSSDGHCRTFDAGADGAVLGEGAGVVILKCLEDALADGDHIYAVVKGSAVNNDGSGKVGYTAPGVKGQAGVIRAALHAAEVEPETISYVETHGTGTRMGDPIEFNALKLAFNSGKKGFCRIGSVKSNMGHLVHAAGVTGFIKTVLSLKHQLIPPSLFFKSPNPEIDLENSPFIVNTGLFDWKNHTLPLRAGVSSFGIGGTNAHVVLEAWSMEHGAWGEEDTHPDDREYKLIILSARTETALEKMTENLVNYLKENPALPDVAYTLQVGRMAFPYRRMAVCSDVNEVVETLSSHSRKMRTSHAKEEKNTIIFMFAGLGAQYVNMGIDLYKTEPIFRETMDQCFELLEPLVNDNVKEIFYPLDRTNRSNRSYRSYTEKMNRIEVAQAVVFSLEYALAKLLMNWGIRPHIMIGYSFGEYTAACISGQLSLADALKLIMARGRLIGRLPFGTMLSVPLTTDELKPLLTGELSIAIDNGPSCIVAGPHRELDTFREQLKQKRCLAMKLPNSYAIHSKMMAPIMEEFEAEVRKIQLNKPQILYISNVTGKRITEVEAADPMYWCRHLRETVRFADGIELLKKEPNPIFIEIGPGRDLTTLLVRHKEETTRMRGVNLIRPQQQEVPDDSYLLNKIGRLWLYGVNIDWQVFYAGKKRCRISLPTYPFERRRYWIEGASIKNGEEILFANPLPRKKINGEFPGTNDIADGNETLYERPELSSEYAPPSDEREEKIVLIWRDCFGIQDIGIDDDFFELGGDSLLATTMISRVHRVLGVPIPLVEVFNLRTTRKMAAYAGKRMETMKGVFIGDIENLVFLKGSIDGNAANFFCIHDISGDVEGYIEFCNRLGIDFNFWGIKADRVENYTPLNLTVQELAEKYLEAVRALQPHGPYYIMGWSFGGFVGFEMVRLLEQSGEEIRFFAGVDAWVFEEGLIDTSNDFSLESETNWLRAYLKDLPDSEIKEKVDNVSEIRQLWPLMVEYLQTNDFGKDTLKKMLPGNMDLIVPDFDRLEPGQLIHHLNTLRTFNRALNTFVPTGKINTPVHFFKASRSIGNVRTDHWETCSSQPTTFYEVPGDHFSLFTMPDVAGLAEKFEEALKQAIKK